MQKYHLYILYIFSTVFIQFVFILLFSVTLLWLLLLFPIKTQLFHVSVISVLACILGFNDHKLYLNMKLISEHTNRIHLHQK